MENEPVNIQHRAKLTSGYDLFTQSQQQKATEIRAAIVLDAENKIMSYLSGQYGSAKLDRESKVDLVARKGSQDNLVYDGLVTVFATISAGAAAKKLSLTAKVSHSTVSIPKLKFISKIVADTKVEGELREALPTEVKSSKGLKVDLAAFKVVSSGEKVLDVFHPVYGDAVLGKLTQAELDNSDKTPLVAIGSKGSFGPDHSQKVLAGKSFEVTDVDGDMVQLSVGKVSGWLPRNEIPFQTTLTAETKEGSIALGEKVLITAELKEYYGDTIEAKDVVGKEATIARLSDSEIVLSVDNVAEDVVLSKAQIGVLKAVAIPVKVSTSVKLESILRDLVADRFPGTEIKFVGKFAAPEVINHTIPVKASIEKVASMENTEMASEDLELKFKQSSGFDRFMASEVQKMANQKRAIAEKASSELAVLLNKSFSPVRLLDTTSALDYEYGQGHSGKIVVSAEVMDSKGIKRIAVEVPVSKDIYSLPSGSDLSTLVSKTPSEQDKFTENEAKEVSAKMAKIDAEESFKAGQIEAALETPKVQKTAGAGTLQPQEQNIQPVVKIDKTFLPASLQVGAVIDLSGIRYKLTSKSGEALSKGASDSTFWTFERISENSSEAPSFRDTH